MEPLVKTDGRILKQGASLEGKLLPALRALPDFAGLQEHGRIGSTMGARNALRPARIRRLRKGEIDIAVSFNGFQKSSGTCVHESIVKQIYGCVKYIIAPIFPL